MSGDRLDKGFVTWNGHRVFVPMFGAPRLVPMAQDEVHVVKLKFRMHLVMAAIFIVPILLLIGIRALVNGAVDTYKDAPILDGEQGDLLALVVCLVFGIGAALERRHWRAWPPLDPQGFSRARFLQAYFRGQTLSDRMLELGLSGLALFYLLPRFREVIESIEASDPAWWLVHFGAAVLGLGGLSFLVLRHASIILASFVPARTTSTH
jgi:hypothetical protein